jgi:stage II sporulation protein AA (anti-sigma F factor antagonist)
MIQDDSPYFRAKQSGDVAVARVDGPEIRHPTPASELSADVFKLVDPGGIRKVLLNMREVRYLSSTAFASLLNLSRRVQGAGGILKICELHPDVQVGANIIGLGRIIDTYGSESEALESFGA